MSHWPIAVLKIRRDVRRDARGLGGARRGRFNAETASALRRFLVNVALPALILDQMITAMGGAALRRGYSMPFVAVAAALVCLGVGVGLGGALRPPWPAPHFRVLVAVPNPLFPSAKSGGKNPE